MLMCGGASVCASERARVCVCVCVCVLYKYFNYYYRYLTAVRLWTGFTGDLVKSTPDCCSTSVVGDLFVKIVLVCCMD